MRTLLVASAVLLAGFAPAPLPRRERVPDDGARLEGTWVVEEIYSRGEEALFGGQRNSLFVVLTNRLVIRQERATFSEFDGESPSTYAIRLSRSGGVGAIDFLQAKRGQRLRGIYKLRGDVLILSVTGHGRDRPQWFTGTEPDLVILLRRRKP